MTNLIPDRPDALSSIETIKVYLAGLVRTAFDGRAGSPVRLTYLGGEFAKSVGNTFEKHLTALAEQGQVVVPPGRRKLAPFIEAYCSDIIDLKEDPPGVYFVSPLALADSNAPPVTAALRFHRAVWAAFIRPLEGKKRFLNLEKVGFTSAAEMPAGGHWREIEERFILGLDPHAQVDGAALQANIEAWSAHTGIPISKLVVGAKPPRESSRHHLEQLLEIIDTLPASVAEQWSIPAAVLKHLRDAR